MRDPHHESHRHRLSLKIPDVLYVNSNDRASLYSEASTSSYDRSSVQTFATYGSIGSNATGTSQSSDGPESELDDSWRLFSVLCLYDFSSDDPDHLPFRKNEILDVVKQEDSGWWAALGRNGGNVGWIPSAYVAQLTDEMTETLLGKREEIRVFEYEAELLYNTAPTTTLNHLYSPDVPSPNYSPQVRTLCDRLVLPLTLCRLLHLPKRAVMSHWSPTDGPRNGTPTGSTARLQTPTVIPLFPSPSLGAEANPRSTGYTHRATCAPVITARIRQLTNRVCHPRPTRLCRSHKPALSAPHHLWHSTNRCRLRLRRLPRPTRASRHFLGAQRLRHSSAAAIHC